MANSVPLYQLARGNFNTLRMISGEEFYDSQFDPQKKSESWDVLHDGDYFIRTAERDARKATMRFILLTCAVMACGFAIWWLVR